MKYLRNPIDGKVVVSTPLMAKRLARYGYEYVTRQVYLEYQRSNVQAALIRHVPAARPKLGLFN